MSFSTRTATLRIRNGLTSERHGRGQLGRSRLGVQLLDVVEAETLDERVLGVVLDPPRLVAQEGLPGQVERGEREPGPAARGGVRRGWRCRRR